jgi:hypothetical protein
MTEREPGYYLIRQQALYEPAYYAGFGLWYFIKKARPVKESKDWEIVPHPINADMFDDQLESFKADTIKIIEKHKGDHNAIIEAINNLYQD